MTKPKSDLEKFSDAIEKARAIVLGTIEDDNNAGKMIQRLNSILIDYRRYTLVDNGEQPHFMIVDRSTGTVENVDGYKARLLRWQIEDPDTYNEYADNFKKFLSQFGEGSIFVQMFGADASKVLPPTIGKLGDDAK